MNAPPFDAVITLNDHHLEAAGLTGRQAEAVAAVRQAIGRLDGAGWIDVAAQYFPPKLPGWVVVYPPGRSDTPATSAWGERRRQVEAAATAALMVAGHLFRSAAQASY